MNKIIIRLFQSLLILIPCITITSGIAAVYNANLNNLLSIQGMRWAYTNVSTVINSLPWGTTLVILVSISVLVQSGLFTSVVRLAGGKATHMAQKEQRALIICCVYLIFALCMTAHFAMIPDSPLLSVFGTFADSILQDGIIVFTCVHLCIISNVYGYLSGHLYTNEEIIKAHTWLPSASMKYALLLILADIVYSMIEYVTKSI